MSEERKEPEKVLIEVTIPTKDQVIEGIKSLFPTVSVKVIGVDGKPIEEI